MNEQQTKHTPGPWKISGCCFIHHSVSDEWFHELIVETGDAATNPKPCIAIVNCRAYVATEKQANKPDPEALANARLIAAAPELLEALKRCHSAFQQSPLNKDDDWVQGRLASDIRAAINKATRGG